MEEKRKRRIECDRAREYPYYQALQGLPNSSFYWHMQPSDQNVTYILKLIHTIPCRGQITPASLLWTQLWLPTPLWGQSLRDVSFPLQPTLSKKIDSIPGAKMPLLFAVVSAIASVNCAAKIYESYNWIVQHHICWIPLSSRQTRNNILLPQIHTLSVCRSVARIFRRGVTWVSDEYVYIINMQD